MMIVLYPQLYCISQNIKNNNNNLFYTIFTLKKRRMKFHFTLFLLVSFIVASNVNVELSQAAEETALLAEQRQAEQHSIATPPGSPAGGSLPSTASIATSVDDLQPRPADVHADPVLNAFRDTLRSEFFGPASASDNIATSGRLPRPANAHADPALDTFRSDPSAIPEAATPGAVQGSEPPQRQNWCVRGKQCFEQLFRRRPQEPVSYGRLPTLTDTTPLGSFGDSIIGQDQMPGGPLASSSSTASDGAPNQMLRQSAASGLSFRPGGSAQSFRPGNR